MTKAELITAVAEKSGLSKKDSEKAVGAVVDAITDALKAGEKVALVGFGTFETKTRNTLDLSAVPMIKKLSHLPVIIEPSHATGLPWMVEPMTLAAIAAGADGVMIEVHNDPPKALCDGAQSLRPDQFAELMQKVKKLSAFMKTL